MEREVYYRYESDLGSSEEIDARVTDYVELLKALVALKVKTLRLEKDKALSEARQLWDQA